MGIRSSHFNPFASSPLLLHYRVVDEKSGSELLASEDGFNHMLYAILRHDIIMDYIVTKLTEKFVVFFKETI